MAPDSTALSGNQILGALSAPQLAFLTPHLRSVDLTIRKELEWPNRAIKHVYFPDSGLVSVVALGARQKHIEVGIIGREGMTGLMVVMGNDRSPHSTYVQISGKGHRIAADDLRRAMRESPALREMLLHFTQSFMIQATHTALSNGSARLEERLARWLLMAHDRIEGDALPLVHEFLAMMLGVRRPGVTVALHSLEQQGLIRAGRGVITVVDRKGLEGAANSSYGVPEAEYTRLMRPH